MIRLAIRKQDLAAAICTRRPARIGEAPGVELATHHARPVKTMRTKIHGKAAGLRLSGRASAQGPCLFIQMHLMAAVGKFNGCRQTRQATADNNI